MDPKKFLEMTEVDFRQKLEISILIFKKFGFFGFFTLEGPKLEKIKIFKNA